MTQKDQAYTYWILTGLNT